MLGVESRREPDTFLKGKASQGLAFDPIPFFIAENHPFCGNRFLRLGLKQMRRSKSLSLSSVMQFILCLLILGNLSALVVAQEAQTVPRSPDTSASETISPRKEVSKGSGKGANDIAFPSSRTIYIQNKNNELIEVLKDATFEKFEEFIQSRGKTFGPSSATITEISIIGTADDDRANLNVTFTIRVNQADEYVSVPLGLKEGSLRNVDYKGDGEQAPSTDKKDSDQGLVWWFRGKGLHRLELSLSVRLLKELPSRRLVLSLPPSPITRMKVTLPYASVSTKVIPDQTYVEVKPAADGKTSVEAIGLGSKLDLTWQPTVEIRPNEVALESQTTLRAQVDADRVILRAQQQVKSLQGLFEQVVVRLPTGAELIKLDDGEKLSYRVDPDNRQRVIITLKDKSNSALLNWTLHLAAKLPMSLVIDGFIVEGARKQTGRVGISLAEGLRLSDPRDPSILGINAGEFPVFLGPVSRAWQFFGQPFKFSVTVDEVKPYFQVKPTLRLTASAQQLVLDGEFEYRVDRDSLHEVVLVWPGHKSEGWTIDSFDEAGIVESYSVDEKGLITARLVKRRAGVFAVHLRARRPIKAAEEVVFSLPRPKSASRLLPANLILVNAENVETDLAARGETVFHLLPSSSLDLQSLPASTRGLKASIYRIDTDEQSFGLRVIPQKQRIRTESLSEARWQDNQFRIVQRLTYDVSYERLAQVRLSVPMAIDIDRVHFTLKRDPPDRDLELTKELLATPATGPRQVQLNLGEAQLGRFEIQARFVLTFAKESAFDSDSLLTLPIVGSLDERFSQTSVSISQSDWFEAEPASGETWRPQLNLQESLQWMADGAQESLTLKIARSTHAYETGNVSRALINLALDESGNSIVRSQFRVTTRATTLPIHLPSGISRPPVFYWDSKRLPERESPVGSHKYTVQLPESPEGDTPTAHLLTIDYQQSVNPALTWAETLKLEAPQLPTCSWEQVIWQTVIPARQNLLTYPPSATPMFRWQRTGLFWSRVSVFDADRLQHWVTTGTADLPPPADALISEKAGNLYSFSQFDSPRPLVFQTLSFPMVLLIGAGFSLVVGFIMFRLAILRHVLTLLVVGMIVAAFGLWYSAPLELLFQPMLAGLVLSAMAVLLNGWSQRRYYRETLSFEGQGDFPPLNAFGSNFVVRQSDPNDATVHRPANRDSQSSIAVESGSGVS